MASRGVGSLIDLENIDFEELVKRLKIVKAKKDRKYLTAGDVKDECYSIGMAVSIWDAFQIKKMLMEAELI